MGWFGDFVSSVGSFISECASSVGSALRSFGAKVVEVGTRIFETCVSVGKTLLENSELLSRACAVVGTILAVVYPPLGVPLNKILSVASKAFMVLGKVYGLFNPEESMEEIGEKVLEATAQGKIPENYSSWDEYIEAVRETELSGDPDKYTYDEKIIAFMGACDLGLGWKAGLDKNTIEMLLRFEDFFTDARLEVYRREAAKSDFDFADISVYFTGQGTCEEMSKAYEFMRKAERSWNPEFDEKKFYAEILDLKDSIEAREDKCRAENY